MSRLGRLAVWGLVSAVFAASGCAGSGQHAEELDTGLGDTRVGDGLSEDLDQLPDSPDQAVEPCELAPYVRLAATDPVLQPLMLWPREADDAIATVRDDWPASAWRAPAGASVLELDLIPLAGRPLALDSLTLSFDGVAPDLLTLTVAPACGTDSGSVLPWPNPELAIPLEGVSAGCLTVSAQAAVPFTVDAISLVARDAAANCPSLPEASTAGEPRHASSGVVEGFYGVPWSWGERKAMVVHLGQLGLGVYIHAPKNDPRHRAEWRLPYQTTEMARFGELAALGDAVGVSVMAGISPFVDWGPDEAADRVALASKLDSFLAVGVHAFVLLADDIEFDVDVPVDGAMGKLHVSIANELLAHLRQGDPGAELWFVPTVYSDERLDLWAGGPDYLAALAELDPDVTVMWTGPDTSNALLEGEDFDRFLGIVGRPPVLWENYWANDGGDGFTGRLPLAPYAGRSPSVVGAVGGIVANPLIHGALSRLPVTSMAHFLDDPLCCDASAARLQAAEAEVAFTGGVAADELRDTELLVLVQSLFDSDTIGWPGWLQMDTAVGALTSTLAQSGSLPLQEVATLLPLFCRMITLGTEVTRSGLSADLDDELLYPLRKVRFEGEAGLYALLTLGDRLAGRASSPHWVRANAALKQSMICRYTFSLGVVEALLDAVAAVTPVDVGVEPIACDAPFPPCRKGEEVQWTPCGLCAELSVAGLPGAVVVGGEVRWTPTLAGRYTTVAACVGPSGWGATSEDIVCQP